MDLGRGAAAVCFYAFVNRMQSLSQHSNSGIEWYFYCCGYGTVLSPTPPTHWQKTHTGWQTHTQCSHTNTQILREDSARPTHPHRAAIFYWLHLFFSLIVVGLQFEIVFHLHPSPCQDPVRSLGSAASSSHFTAVTFSNVIKKPINPFPWCKLPVVPLAAGCSNTSKCIYHVYQKCVLKCQTVYYFSDLILNHRNDIMRRWVFVLIS